MHTNLIAILHFLKCSLKFYRTTRKVPQPQTTRRANGATVLRFTSTAPVFFSFACCYFTSPKQLKLKCLTCPAKFMVICEFAFRNKTADNYISKWARLQKKGAVTHNTVILVYELNTEQKFVAELCKQRNPRELWYLLF